MKLRTLRNRIKANPTALITGATVLAAAFAFGLTAMAADGPAENPKGDDDPLPKQCQHESHEAEQLDSSRKHDGPPPPRRGDRGRPEGPPPPRDAYGSQDQYGEDGERHARGEDRGHRPPRPHHRGNRDDRNRDSGNFKADERRQPGPPPGPPAFDDIDSNGDGSVSREEFDTFHESHRPPHPADGGRDRNGPPHNRRGNDGPPPPRQ